MPEVFGFLKDWCMYVKQYKENVRKNSTPQELKDVVKELSKLVKEQEEIKIHINLCEKLLNLRKDV